MHPWIEANLRALLERNREEGQADLILVALLAFVLALLVAGRRIVVQ